MAADPTYVYVLVDDHQRVRLVCASPSVAHAYLRTNHAGTLMSVLPMEVITEPPHPPHHD